MKTIQVIFLVVLLLAPPVAARSEIQVGTFVYQVIHPVLGDIGTYRNSIEKTDDGYVVTTELRVVAKLWFIVVSRSEGERRSVWRNGRLVSFDSTTVENGEAFAVTGRAQGDLFVIERTGGGETVPARVGPTNPWRIPQTSEAAMVMGSRTGLVKQVQISGGERVTLDLDGRQLQARHFRLAGGLDQGEILLPQEVWYDDNDLAVKFTLTKDGEIITFILR